MVWKGENPVHKPLFGAFLSGFRAKPRGQSAFVSTCSMRCFSRMGQVMGQKFAVRIDIIQKHFLGQMNGSIYIPPRHNIWDGYRRTNKREKVYKSRNRSDQIYQTGSCKTFSRKVPGIGQRQMIAPIPRFLFSILSSMVKAAVSSAVTWVLCLISMG